MSETAGKAAIARLSDARAYSCHEETEAQRDQQIYPRLRRRSRASLLRFDASARILSKNPMPRRRHTSAATRRERHEASTGTDDASIEALRLQEREHSALKKEMTLTLSPLA